MSTTALITLIINIVIALIVVAWIGSRQMKWRAVEPARLWRAPLIIGIIGLVMTAQVASTLTVTDIALILVELALGLAVGSIMARGAQIAPRPANVKSDAPLAVRIGWAGLALLVSMILIRVALSFGAIALGAHAATATGTILLMLAANRAGWAAMLTNRTARLERAERIGA